jgi:hypothetical protein
MTAVNRWMNNPQYLAQVGHLFFGSTVTLVAALFGGLFAMWISLGALTLYATVKEFWYDLRYEVPKQTFGDSAMDFAFIVGGGAVGAALECLKVYR